MSVCFKDNLTKKPLFYNCGHCNKTHFGRKEISFYNPKNERYYCKDYIIESDNSFSWDMSMSREELEKLYNSININQKIKIANNILKDYGFRRLSNGESIYTEIYDVLRIENNKLFLNVFDEYYDIFDVPESFMFDIYEKRFLNRYKM